jgi:hypothetical protein
MPISSFKTNSGPLPYNLFEVDDNSGGEYFKAFHQWNVYIARLLLYPVEEERSL